MFPRLSSTYVGHAKAWQYYERRIIRTFESRRLWAEPVLIRTWYLRLGAGSWQRQLACCCEWRCFHRDADASDVNSSGVPRACRNLTGQTLQMIKSGDRYSCQLGFLIIIFFLHFQPLNLVKRMTKVPWKCAKSPFLQLLWLSLRKGPFIFLNCFFPLIIGGIFFFLIMAISREK